jgi:hypothetical protein
MLESDEDEEDEAIEENTQIRNGLSLNETQLIN